MRKGRSLLFWVLAGLVCAASFAILTGCATLPVQDQQALDFANARTDIPFRRASGDAHRSLLENGFVAAYFPGGSYVEEGVYIQASHFDALTILHELAHALQDGYRHQGRVSQCERHGEEWGKVLLDLVKEWNEETGRGVPHEWGIRNHIQEARDSYCGTAQ